MTNNSDNMVHDFVQNYEFRGDSDYTPTDGERTLIEDAIHGFLAEVDNAKAIWPKKTLKFSGHSDDIFCINGSDGKDDDEIYYHKNVVSVTLKSSEGSMVVSGAYAVHEGGVWMIGISPTDEDVPMPDWPMRWSFDNYTTVLEIDVPENTTVTKPDAEDD